MLDKKKKLIPPLEELEAAQRPVEENPQPSKGNEIDTQYSTTLQGKPLHGLIASSTTNGGLQIDAVTHAGTMQSDGVLITIDEEAIQNISSQTFKVLIIFLTALTSQLPHGDIIQAEAIQKGRSVRIGLDDYMRACRIKDKKEARAQLNAAVRAIYSVSLEWDEQVYERPEGRSRAVKTTKHHRMRITDHTITEAEGNPVKGGAAEIRFSFDMAEYLSNAYIMPYPDALLSINTHNHPYSIPLGWRLCALYNMNFGKKNQNYTSVKTLLNAAKGIPSYESISSIGGVYNRIIGRLDRDLAALEEAGVLSSYWYFSDDGTIIDRSHLGLLTYTEFIALNVHFELSNYPDQTPRLEAKSKRIKAAISRRKSAAKKKAERDGEQQ